MILATTLLTVGCQSKPATTSGSVEGIEKGDVAPDFQLYNLGGEPIALSDFQDKPVLINFWATTCPPCRAEMPYIQQLYEGWTEEQLGLLCINIGEASTTIDKFMQDQSLSFPVLLDTQQTVSRQYNIRYIPTTFFIDKDGIIQEVKVGSFQSKKEIENIINKIIS